MDLFDKVLVVISLFFSILALGNGLIGKDALEALEELNRRKAIAAKLGLARSVIFFGCFALVAIVLAPTGIRINQESGEIAEPHWVFSTVCFFAGLSLLCILYYGLRLALCLVPEDVRRVRFDP